MIITILDRLPTCKHTTKVDIFTPLVQLLNKVEDSVGQGLTYNSCVRCPVCNQAVGGSVDSAHLRGKAADMGAYSAAMRYKILYAAFTLDVARIGIGKRFVHLDVDDKLPQRVCWLY